MRKQNKILALTFAAIVGGTAFAGYSSSLSSGKEKEEPGNRSNISAPVYFRQGKSNIDRNFMGNSERIDTFLNSLRRILADSSLRITDVTVTGLASVEGGYSRNMQLAGERADALASLMVREGGLPQSLIHTVNGGENWDGLLAMVEESNDIPDKRAVLDLLYKKTAPRDSVKRVLMNMNGGRPWRYMYANFFPTLRTGAGGVGSERHISPLSQSNLQLLRQSLIEAGYDPAMLDKIGLGENAVSMKNSDVEGILRKLQGMMSPEKYDEMSHQAFEGMLRQNDELTDINWTLLRKLIAQSNIEKKDSILMIIDNVPAAAGREKMLRQLNNGKSYREIERLYPELLVSKMNAESNSAEAEVRRSITILRYMLAGSGIEGSDMIAEALKNETTLAGMQRIIDGLRTDPRYSRLIEEAGIPDSETFARISAEERTVKGKIATLRYLLAGSGIEGSEKVVAALREAKTLSEQKKVIDSIQNDPKYKAIFEKAGITNTAEIQNAAAGQEDIRKKIESLCYMLAGSGIEGSGKIAASLESAKTVAEQQKIIESLRKDSRFNALLEKAGIPDAAVFAQAAAGNADSGRSRLVEENWTRLRELISTSGISASEKRKLLGIIDSTPNSAERLTKINQIASKETRELINGVFFTDLLYGLSEDSKKNWAIVEKAVRESDIAGKEEILAILSEYPAGEERIEILKSLGNGEVWNRVREKALSSLLLDSEETSSRPVSGITLSFETVKPELEKKIPEVKQNVAAEVKKVKVIKEKRKKPEKTKKISIDIETDLGRDIGLQPGFKLGGPTPNLSVGVNFAGNWGVQGSLAYCNWNALAGDNSLFAVTAYGFEGRYWFGKKYRYRGIYAGVYFTGGDFDVQDKDLTRGDTGTYWNAGIAGGYLLRIGTTGFIIDLGLRLGYRSASYDAYTIGHGHYEGHFYRDETLSGGAFSPAIRLGIGYRF